MKIQATKFNGSSSLFDTQQHLQSVAGTATWLAEFRPRDYEHRNFIELLLKTFCTLGIFCFISGAFPAFTAGVFNSYCTTSMFLAITNSTLLDPLLRRNGSQEENFTIVTSEFH